MTPYRTPDRPPVEILEVIADPWGPCSFCGAALHAKPWSTPWPRTYPRWHVDCPRMPEAVDEVLRSTHPRPKEGATDK